MSLKYDFSKVSILEDLLYLSMGFCYIVKPVLCSTLIADHIIFSTYFKKMEKLAIVLNFRSSVCPHQNGYDNGYKTWTRSLHAKLGDDTWK